MCYLSPYVYTWGVWVCLHVHPPTHISPIHPPNPSQPLTHINTPGHYTRLSLAEPAKEGARLATHLMAEFAEAFSFIYIGLTLSGCVECVCV